MHYANKDKWRVLWGKRQNAANVFYNEVCGESYDTGAKLITLSDLMRAATLHENKLEEAIKVARYYDTLVLAIDWGGGGADGTSWTVYAVCGMNPDGTVDVIYGERSLTPHDANREARIAINLAHRFECKLIAHDYSGAGTLREHIIINSGFPMERVMPMWLVPAATQGPMRYVAANPQHPRSHYKIDKPRTLALTCHQIRTKNVRFFKDDYKGEDDPGLLRDFLSLAEEKTESRRGRDFYTIIRSQNTQDDFAHAVNFGCCALWYIHNQWPDVAISKYAIDQDILDHLSPAPGAEDWETTF